MTNAICYHRFSTRRQDRGSSIERQNDATRALCESHGLRIAEIIEDRGRSAWKGDHLTVGNLGALRKRIDAGLVESGTHIVVENLDRLSRQNYRTARRWIEDVTDRGITILVCRPALMLDRAAMSGVNIGAIVQHAMESNRASSEGDRRSAFQQRNIERMTQMIREGLCPTPRVPAWLVGVVGQPVTIDKSRVALINLIYEWSAGGLGLQAICKRLNAGYEPWTGRGWKTGVAQWRIGYVRDILTSPAIEGRYVVRAGTDRTPTGEVISGYYPRVVNANLVAEARAGLRRRLRTGGAARGEALNLFTGMITCGGCGGVVGRVSGGKGYAYLTCRSARYGTCMNKAHMPYDALAKVVVDHLLHLALDDVHFTSTDRLGPILARLAEARAKVETLTLEQGNLIQVLRSLPNSMGVISALQAIEINLQAATADVGMLDAELAEARGTVPPDEHLRRVRTVSDSLATDASARRMVRDALPSLIRKMVWDGSKVTISGLQFFLMVDRAGRVDGFDLFHPKHGAKTSPDYARRRDAALAADTYFPFVY